MAHSQGTHSDPLLSQLSAALAEAQSELKTSTTQLDAAKAACEAARAETKKLTRLIAMYKGQADTGTSKEVVRPLVASLLEAGPLSEKEVSEQLTATLREQSLPHSGLSFVIKALRPEFSDSQGIWQLDRSNRSESSV